VTLATLRDRVAKRIDEDVSQANRYISDVDLNASINFALSLYSYLTLCLETTANVQVSSQTAYVNILTTIPDCIVPLRVTQGGRRLFRESIQGLSSRHNAWSGEYYIPEFYAMASADLLAVYPAPASASVGLLSLTYARFAPVLALDSDEPIIPLEAHEVLVDGAAAFIRIVKLGGQYMDDANDELRIFLDACALRVNFVRTQSKTSRYDVSPPDLGKAVIAKLLESYK